MNIIMTSMNKAAYITVKSGVMGEVIWDKGSNAIYFPYTKEIKELREEYEKAFRESLYIPVSAVDFIATVGKYRKIIDKDRVDGKHLINNDRITENIYNLQNK